MILTRWKMMAGVLAVSLGGLAAMAGQCTKSEPTKGGTPPDTPTASAPAAKPAALPMMTPPVMPTLPPIPAAEPMKPSELPPPPAVLPVSGTLPAVPPAGSTIPPPLPDALPTPPTPMGNTSEPMTPRTDLPLLPQSGSSAPSLPAFMPRPTNTPSPPMNLPADPQVDTAPPAPMNLVKPATAVAAVQAKYRILLRVGEGEPLFEVRSADHLILKVVCEKVDVKSPEKGQGLSAVKAAGKVRFAGFGAEGTCDELHFLAGTGEVSMTGNVKIQVKDKLGRIESELSADTMRYRIDPQTMTGNGLLKP
jgi:hypothetical protein